MVAEKNTFDGKTLSLRKMVERERLEIIILTREVLEVSPRLIAHILTISKSQ